MANISSSPRKKGAPVTEMPNGRTELDRPGSVYPVKADEPLSNERFHPAASEKNQGGVAVVSHPTSPTKKTTKSAALLSPKEMQDIKSHSDLVVDSYKALKAAMEAVRKSYSKLLKLPEEGPSSFMSRSAKWIFSGCGLFDSRARLEREVSDSVRTLRQETKKSVKYYDRTEGDERSTSLQKKQAFIRSSYSGRTFKINKDTPEILRSVAIPKEKKFVSFDSLKKKVLELAKAVGPDYAIRQPSKERLVLFRKNKEGDWETLELSWRGITKVNIVQKGEKVGNLFNVDAVQLAARFFEDKSCEITPTKYKMGSVWKVV